ncbi:MAG TPA: hypothetical protein VLC92_10210 [Rhodocyclaceae bacterium]|nr:hypothetical protein [Rhodocyclaceae bacterium]
MNFHPHKNSRKTSLLLALASVFAIQMVVPTDAFARGGGGGGRGGGGGGGAARVDSSRADSRSTNVRNTSVNNVNRSTSVNSNRNVNINVDNGGCCNGGGWDNPLAAAAVVGGTIAVTSAVIGSFVHSVPPSCVPINYGGMIYQQCGSTWYAPQGSQYMVVNPPY